MIEFLKIITPLSIALFAYWKFFREGTHRQRIEFDIELQSLGFFNNKRIIEICALAENKGNVEQRFNCIKLRIRGLPKNSELKYVKNNTLRLDFPDDLGKIDLVSEKIEYFFVRPSVKQKFPLVVAIPENWTHVLIRTTFNYSGTKDIHITERAFLLPENNT